MRAAGLLRLPGELLLVVLAPALEPTLASLLGLTTFRPLFAPVVAVRLGLTAGPLEGALLTLAAGLVHEGVLGLAPGLSTFGLMAVLLSTRGLGLTSGAGRVAETAVAVGGVLLWQAAVWTAERLLGPVEGGPTLAGIGQLAACMAASAVVSPLVFAAGRGLASARVAGQGTRR
jgi:hypothetical protein